MIPKEQNTVATRRSEPSVTTESEREREGGSHGTQRDILSFVRNRPCVVNAGEHRQVAADVTVKEAEVAQTTRVYDHPNFLYRPSTPLVSYPSRHRPDVPLVRHFIVEIPTNSMTIIIIGLVIRLR